MRTYQLSHLRALEAEAIDILRELAAERERPVLLFSGGKDSIVILHLSLKAFRPARFPYPLMHVDTGHNFPEAIEYRDRKVQELGERLIVASVQRSIDEGRVVEEKGPRASRNRLQTTTLLDAIAEHEFDAAIEYRDRKVQELGERLIVASVQKSIDEGRVAEEKGPRASRNRLQTTTLLDAIAEHGFDAAIGGARRDEERARAKERIFSHRDEFGQWDPKNQRPELWALYNGRLRKGEHFRVFPLSNWTELDVWQYIKLENIELPELYYARKRKVFSRDGMLYSPAPFIQHLPGETVFEEMVRFRTVGDMSCTGAVRSSAVTLDEVIEEVAASRITERGATRADDRFTEAAMEDRKREGYF